MTPTASASADEPPVPSLVPPMPEPATRWYGWQALLADVPSSLMMTTFFDDLLLSAVGASAFLLVPPAIHFAHWHPIKAIIPFSMRAIALGGPLTIGLYAAHKDCQSGGDLCWVGAEIFLAESAMLTIPTAFVVDDVAIAREHVPAPMVPDAAFIPWAAPVAHGGFVPGVQSLRFQQRNFLHSRPMGARVLPGIGGMSPPRPGYRLLFDATVSCSPDQTGLGSGRVGMFRTIVAVVIGTALVCACGPARSPQEIQASYELRLRRLTDSATGALVRVSCADAGPGRPCGLLVDELLQGFPVEGKLVEYASRVCDEDAAEGLSAMCLDRFRAYFRAAVARRYPEASPKAIGTYCDANDGDCDLGSVASFRLWELLHLRSHNEGVVAQYEVAAEAMADRGRREVEEAQAEEEAAQRRRHALGAALRGLGQGMSAAGQGMSGASRSSAAPSSGGAAGSTSGGCSSDYQCSYGFRCVKAQYSMTGSCARAVNAYGNPTFEPPGGDSFSPGKAECVFTVGDCPIGFQCMKNHCMRQ